MQMVQRVGCAALTVLIGVVGLYVGAGHGPAQETGKPKTKLPQHILIIRHGEKTGLKEDIHLASRGKERAVVLHQLFENSKNGPDPFPMPDFIFAATHHADSQRPVETVTPLAMKLKLTINDHYDSKAPAALAKAAAKGKKKQDGMVELAGEIFGSSRYAGKTILISWRHKTIPELAKTLKARDVPAKWEDKVFDRVWQITYTDSGVTFCDRPMRLLPGDSER